MPQDNRKLFTFQFCILIRCFVALLLTCSHGAQDLVNSFLLFVEENRPSQTDNEVRVLFQKSVLVCLDQVVEGWETVGYPGDSLHLQFVSLQCCTTAHLTKHNSAQR